MATKDDSDIPESGAVFTFGKSKFADNLPNKFWVKNDKVLQIACGDEHTALITESGRVFMFGPNDWGQLGLGNDNKVANKPSCIKSLKHDKSRLVACGRSHTIISTVSGHVYSFGNNSEGQLGIKDISDLSTPKRIETLPQEELKMLSAGSDSSVALTEDGRVYTWGGNEDGKLGLGKVENAEEPILLAMERPAVCVACGYYHTAIVSDDGKLYTMGEADGGKLGLPEDMQPTNVPQHVAEITDPVKWVACGSSHTAALTESGEVYVFGEGESGQLGLGTEVLSCSKPTLLNLPFKVSHVFCGQAFTACISEKGQLYTFGDGRHGKLAHGSDVFSNQFKPFHSKRFSKFLVDKVACGGCHMIVTARPKALNGVEDDVTEDVDEMKKTLISLPVESSGSPSLTRTLSARERRRDEVSRSFSSELNQTLPPLGQSRILPSLSATMPALKSSPKPVKEDTVENGFVPQLQNGKMSDADSGRDDTEDEDQLHKKHKKEDDKDYGSKRSNGSGSEGDLENEEDKTDGCARKKKKKNGKKRKTSKTTEEGSLKDEQEDSWNDDEESDIEDKKENEAVKELESALVEKDDNKTDKDDDDVDSVKDVVEEKEKEEESKIEDKESGKETDNDESRGPVPIPRKQKTDDREDNEEDEKLSGKKDSEEDLGQESEKEEEEERVESEKESKLEEEMASDKEDESKSKKGKTEKDKKKKEEKEEEENVKEISKDDEKEEEEVKEDGKKKGKDKKKDKKDKKKEKEKDKKKKKKGKDEDEEEEKDKDKAEDEDEEEEKDKSDKKSKDKKKDKKDKKKDKGGKGDGKDDEEEEEDGEKEDKKKDKDKKEKDKKKKKGKEDDNEQDENGNTEKPPPKKSRTCNIL